MPGLAANVRGALSRSLRWAQNLDLENQIGVGDIA
jgi:hypothetical protein